MLNTETPNQAHANLDLYSPIDLVSALADDQINAVNAVRAAAADIARAVEAAVPRIKAGGRLIYSGAGTSAAWACLIAWSCIPPLHGLPSERWRCLLAAQVRFIGRWRARKTTTRRVRQT